jgi:GcrA cell cycle regulator
MTKPKSEKVSFWTDEKDTELRRLLGEKKTSSQAGRALGASRNAVVGRAHRLGIKIISGAKNGLVNQAQERRLVHKKKIKAQAEAKVEPAVIHAVRREDERPEQTGRRTVAFSKLQPAQCKWIVDTKPYAQRCCGAKRRANSPYCAEHHAIAHYRY